jgi:hypothetical protein
MLLEEGGGNRVKNWKITQEKLTEKMEPVTGGCKLVFSYDKDTGKGYDCTAGGFFTSTSSGENGMLICAHTIVPLNESDEPQVLTKEIKVHSVNANGDLIPFGVVRNVWFCGRKGWDYCFVELSPGTDGIVDFSQIQANLSLTGV